MLLNRRGFATVVFCRQCGATTECPNCSVSLTVHRAARRARCHYCNYSMAVPKACANCAGPYLEQVGLRHRADRERSRHAVSRRARGAGRPRHDSAPGRDLGGPRQVRGRRDRRARRHPDDREGARLSARVARRRRLRGCRARPGGLPRGRADVPAAHAGGRPCGRGDIRGEAIVQTLHPAHYSILHATRQDYRAFFADESRYRQAMRYPPAVALVNAVVKGRTFQAAMDDAGDLVRALRANGRPLQSPWPRAGSAQPAERRASGAVLHQGHPPARDASGASDGAERSSRAQAAHDRRRGSDERAVESAPNCELSTRTMARQIGVQVQDLFRVGR